MKKAQFLILLLIIMALAGCKRHPELKVYHLEFIEENVAVTTTTIDINVRYSYPSKLDYIRVLLGKKADMSDAQVYDATVNDTMFSVSISGLSVHSMYQYCYEYSNGIDIVKTSTKGIMTIDYSVPAVATYHVNGITHNSAKVGGTVTSDGGLDVTSRGICWGLTPNPTINDSVFEIGNGTGAFSDTLRGLENNTRYYVRAFATNSRGTGYGEQKSFTTSDNTPLVITNPVSNVTASSAKCGGNVTADQGFPVTARGICWGTSPEPTIDGNHTTDGAGLGEFETDLTDLAEDEDYYVRAYATNAIGTSYGETKMFTTMDGMPNVTTKTISGITINSATCGGNVTYDGGYDVTARGICWDTVAEPTIESAHTVNGAGLGEFTSQMENLLPNRDYYVRAYATNAMTTSYGQQRTFKTPSSLPEVNTLDIHDVTYYSAVCEGEVTFDGGMPITVRGFCYSTTQYPTIDDMHSEDGSGTGRFSTTFNFLSSNTTYYVRAYARNGHGLRYGQQKSFTTFGVPVVTLTEITDITETSAVAHSIVENDGGSPVIARGVCWSQEHNPTIDDDHTTDGDGVGEFLSKLEGLQDNTKYRIRAYATNMWGTSYGNDMTFTTWHYYPEGAIEGDFSVSETRKVFFSKGNLQYQASTEIWRFAEHQYDAILLDNWNISPTYEGFIDLYGWATSGYEHGGVSYQPWNTSTDSYDYYAYGYDDLYNLYDNDGTADWGYNAISNGGNVENQWRTLNSYEWSYLLFTRVTASGIRYAKATINDVFGMLILPDNWSASAFTLNDTNDVSSSYYSNNITVSDMEYLESLGVVFLPAGSYRSGTDIENHNPFKAYYWTSTYSSGVKSFYVEFNNTQLFVGERFRYHGLSVRLVQDL